MVDLFLQLLALVILLGGVWFGYRRWVKPHADKTDLQSRGLLMLIVLTFMGGFLGSSFWWFDAAQSFAWDLPPLASRMLASAGWSFAAACLYCLQRPTVRRVRLVLLLTAVYLAPLVAAVFLFHLDRFNFAAPITYGFFILAGSITVMTVWFLFRQPTILRDDALDSAPSSVTLKGWMGALVVLTGVWGAALFVTDGGPSDLIWVWPGDLLTSRLIGVMLLALASGAAYSLPQADTARAMLWVTATYGLGLAVASAWNALDGKPIKVSYLIAFGIVFLVSAGMLVGERRGAGTRIERINAD
jgi:hypothetical protein